MFASTSSTSPPTSMGSPFQTQIPLKSTRTKSSHTSSSGSSTSSTDSEPPFRQDFKTIRALHDDAFKHQLLAVVDREGKFSFDDCKVYCRTNGSFNYVVLMELDSKRYALKVPAQGTRALWQNADALEMRSEVHTMMYIRSHTTIPVMQIFGWDSTFENPLGAPYIVSAAAEGVPAFESFLVYNEDYTLATSANEWPSAPLEDRRRRFLKDLALYMAELSLFQFDASGMLYFSEEPNSVDSLPPIVGPSYDLVHDVEGFPAFSNTRDFLTERVEAWVKRQSSYVDADNPVPTAASKRERAYIKGAGEMMECALTEFPGLLPPEEEGETFVLCHPDLDFQNVLVDPVTGAITAIIDWQGTKTMPRAIGNASLPLFLRTDWEPEYDLAENLSPWALDKYRDLYAEYMKLALGEDSDAKYTRHSYWAWYMFESIGHGSKSNISEFINRVMAEIPYLGRLDKDDFLVRLGSGHWPTAQFMLCAEMQRMFNPEESKKRSGSWS